MLENFSPRPTRQVVRDRKRLLGADHKETLVAVHRHGSVLWELGRYAEAEELWREAVRARRGEL